MKQGALAILPLALGAAIYGFAFGVLAAQVGFSWWGVAAMSALVHAGSSQIVAVEQFSSGSALLGAVFAGAALNIRYLGIIASLADVLKDLPPFMRLIAIHITGDENWALTMAERTKNPQIGASFLLGSGYVMIATWITSTALGALVGSAIENFEQFGLGFAFTAAFIAMARGLYRSNHNILPWIVSFFGTISLVSVDIAPAYAIVLGSFAGLVTIILRNNLTVQT